MECPLKELGSIMLCSLKVINYFALLEDKVYCPWLSNITSNFLVQKIDIFIHV